MAKEKRRLASFFQFGESGYLVMNLDFFLGGGRGGKSGLVYLLMVVAAIADFLWFFGCSVMTRTSSHGYSQRNFQKIHRSEDESCSEKKKSSLHSIMLQLVGSDRF